MKILIVRTWPDQLNINSYNVQEIGLAAALIRAGQQCDIVFYLEKGSSKIEKRTDGITIYWRRGINILKNGFFPGIRKIMYGYDVVQVHEYDQMQSWMLYAFPGASKVVLYHGPYYSSFNHGYNTKCKVFDRIFLKIMPESRLKTLQCLTKSPMAADFLKQKGFQNVRSVGVGLDVSHFEYVKKTGRISELMPSDQINIIYVGKFEERRNIEFLLNVLQNITERHSRVHVTLVGKGTGSYFKRMQPLLQKLMDQKKMDYYPQATQEELASVYQKADLMLFPSNYEIYGMVLMEAMYFNTVCISSMNGGASELIESGKNGMIIESFEEQKWCETAIDVISDTKRMNMMKENAGVKIRNEYTWDHLAETFLSAYQENL